MDDLDKLLADLSAKVHGQGSGDPLAPCIDSTPENAVTCNFCNEFIMSDDYIIAGSNTFHKEHFFCSQCGELFPEEATFYQHEGRAYCEADFIAMFSEQCYGCNQPLLDNILDALGHKWHTRCFTCHYKGCTTNLSQQGFLTHNDEPFCATHYPAVASTLCMGCDKPIEGRCFTVNGRKFHIDHFICSFCKQRIELPNSPNQATFRWQSDKPFCMKCHIKLYG
ncbi:hypothetical protein CXG81DRAFT_18007 [Caulochytrium protostelioides]|uniref:LIM zinc-binding domain-containing protein n=1 Tax=Caulochytrium protostelioides TaxID=1555241 RepID=A0A4P9XAE3_9FUNG|nr:hypothetical protein CAUPRSCDRAFT_10559 [Caulochytrium protostelioides]RKP02343.1 hypothetical protein CXG81DRAFT_18007 [Caulochytrium protostelioides]|eukprot:RKP02343.1 hypothetical protein CXG81DRAFT_18007 [Caulochytrium protostelioides]